ncbi:MAG: PepSY domain-containing protein [Lachnospiraceae bacterium]|nr:PepSY domain-containing protein [Lachnospiraceae bacterium]
MRKAKKLFVILCATLLTFTSILPAGAATKQVIGTTKVKSIVRKSASDLKGKTLTIKLKTDDGVRYYDVTGKTATRKYEFEVDAYSGKILERDWESRKKTKGKKSLTKAEARAKVDKQVTARKNQKYYTIETDYENGIKFYEIEFKTATRSYELEVNATTGYFTERDWELRNKTPNIPTSTKITKAEAISIAKNKIKSKLGLTTAQAKEIKVIECTLEKENVRYEYEIELRYRSYECDFEINANTGAIIDYDIEIDD